MKESAKVLKFGGSSVGNPLAIEQSAKVTESHVSRGSGIVVVVSAAKGVTDTLVGSVRLASNGSKDYLGKIELLAEMHMSLISDLASPEEVKALKIQTAQNIDDVTDVLRAMSLTKTPADANRSQVDFVISLGERLMAPLFASHLRAKGTGAISIDANDVFITDKMYGDAIANTKESKRMVHLNVRPHLQKNEVVVIPGFYGRPFATFGRGGSDYSATKIAELLSSSHAIPGVFLYKADVAGAMSADPKIVGDSARRIPHLTYQEAGALAVSDARLLHSRSIEPVVKHEIPIFCKSTLNPSEPGTVIDGQTKIEDYRAKIVTAFKGLTWLQIDGWSMNRPGIIDKVASFLSKEGIDIRLISQTVSELAIDLAFSTPEDGARALEARITEELSRDFTSETINRVKITDNMAAIQVVGSGISHPDVLIPIFEGLKTARKEQPFLEPSVMSQGPVDLSFLVPNYGGGNVNETVKSIHEAIADN
jgi:bifunctional aspartokinase / homoserine dehydrogenase 1